VYNLGIIDERNKLDGASHGVTKFSDLSQEEFERHYLGGNTVEARDLDDIERVTLVKDTTTTSANWVGIYTTPVKNQGYCGSCWAFSAVEQIESNSIMAGYLTTQDELSTQQLVSW
jgi:C1A family cysteine protease